MAVKFYQKGNYQVLDGDVERIGQFDIVAEGTVVNIIDRNKESNVWNGNISDIQDSLGTSIGSTFNDLISYISSQFINTVSVSSTGGGDDSVVNKFGYNADVDQVTGEEIIAYFGGTWNPLTQVITTAQTLTITYNNTTDGFGQIGATLLQITYIDENSTQQTAIHVMGSDGSDVSSFTCLGVNRAVVIALGSSGANVNDITLTATTDGTTQAVIPAGTNVTQQCIYHTPISRTLNLDFLNISAIKTTGGGAKPELTIRGYSFSRLTRGVYEVINLKIDTAVENNIVIPYVNPITFTGREVLFFTCESDTDNANISLRFSGVETNS